MVNASFDVFLEGPTGGIWFWSLFGLGIAALEIQRRQTTETLSPDYTRHAAPNLSTA
jgi:hypothetical protein